MTIVMVLTYWSWCGVLGVVTVWNLAAFVEWVCNQLTLGWEAHILCTSVNKYET